MCYKRGVNVVVHLRAVRPSRLAASVADEALADDVRDLLPFVRGARPEPIADGIRLVLDLGPMELAELADLVRGMADERPFWTFRLLEDLPHCWLEVTGADQAGALARAVFGGMVAGRG